MAELLHADGLGNKGLSVVPFAQARGLSVSYVRKLCKEGKIFGARLQAEPVNGGFTHRLSCYANQEKAEKIHRSRCIPSR